MSLWNGLGNMLCWRVPKTPELPRYPLTEAALAVDEIERRGRALQKGVDRAKLIGLVSEDLTDTDLKRAEIKAVARLEAAFEPLRPAVKFFVRRLAPWSAFN